VYPVGALAASLAVLDKPVPPSLTSGYPIAGDPLCAIVHLVAALAGHIAVLAESAFSPLLRGLALAAGSLGARPAARGASAELDVPAESEPSLLLHALTGDPLRTIAQLIGDANLPCFRLVCRAFCDHSSPAQKKCRTDLLRTRTLAVFAWDSMPGFIVDLPTMHRLVASVGRVDILEELVDNRVIKPHRAAAKLAAAARATSKRGLHPPYTTNPQQARRALIPDKSVIHEKPRAQCARQPIDLIVQIDILS